MSEVELMKRKIIKFIEETDDIEILNQIISMINEFEAKKKPEYFNSIDATNIVYESEAIFQTQQMEDFEVPQEWIDEADEAGRRMDSGEDKGYTHEEIMKMAYAHLESIQKKAS